MGETTGITWTDHTFNPWIGCTKVSQGCKLCYAETQNHRYNWNPAGWGPGAPRKRTSEANWKKPIQWARQAVKDGVTRRVFCASLADVFDGEVSDNWRYDLWCLMQDTAQIGGLEWLLLTKRPENIKSMLWGSWLKTPPDFIRLGVTVENQANAIRAHMLLDNWDGKNFLSMEPLIERVTLRSVMRPSPEWNSDIDWVIVGGESGAGCRPMDIEWARELHDHCKRAKVPFFMKQLGGHPDKQHDPEKWPEDLRVQEFPKA